MMFMEDRTVLMTALVEGCATNTAGQIICQTEAQLAEFNAAAPAFDRGEVGSSFQNFLYWQTYNMKWSFFAGYDLLATAAFMYFSAISQKMIAAAKPTAAE